MNALNTLHAALRPGGLLLDVRPAPQHPWVEIVCAGHVVPIGQLDDACRMGTLATADAALQTLIEDGRFVRERKRRFAFVYHFDGVERWLEHMGEHWHTAGVSADLVARARELLPPGAAGEVRIPRVIDAARLRRVP